MAHNFREVNIQFYSINFGKANTELNIVNFNSRKEWGTFELESAKGKNSAREGFGQNLVRLSILLRLISIRESIGNFFTKYL